MGNIQKRASGELRSLANNALQSWVLKVGASIGMAAWAVIEGITVHFPTAYLIVVGILTLAATAHLLILIDAWRRSMTVNFRLQSSGYPFQFNSKKDEDGAVVITEGAAPIQLSNTSISPIHFRFKSLSVIIDGKTREDMYGDTERECYTLPPNFSIGFATKVIQLGVAAPGYVAGMVQFEIEYGKSARKMRHTLKRKYRLHIFIAESGQTTTNGGELEVSIPMEEPAV